jgi:LacI family transcriptional regulator
MAKKATIEDIARLAGVSRGTVSRVLNHRPDVETETRARVLRIIQEQGYAPSLAASGLAGGRSRLIGALVPVFTWPFLADLVRGITDILKPTQYELVLYTFDDEDLTRDRRDVVNRLLATHLTAGLLAIYPGGLFSEQLTELYRQGVPVVIIDDQREQVTPWVRANDTAGAYAATRHLIHLGHRRIAHIQGPSEYLVSHDRYQGYLRALEEADINPDPRLVLEGDFLPQSGYSCAMKLFDLDPGVRPTAIFAAADQMAYGALRAAEERGIAIPREIALVGYDDDAPSAHVLPPLTTVHQPSYEMGQEGIKLLLTLLAAVPEYERAALTSQAPPERIVLPARLVIRASCGATESVAHRTT